MSPPAASSAPFVQSGDSLEGFLRAFWQRQIDTAEQDALTPISTKDGHAHPSLPLARIKKVMKSDPDVKQMIAADAPILFAKACEIFIAEITARAFIVADADKRRTLSRSDIAKALGKSDQFDFLIDIVPREGDTPPKSSKRGKKDDDRQRSLPDIEDRPDSIEIMAHGHALDDDPDLTGVVSAGPSAGDPQLGGLAVDQMGLFDHFLNPDL